MKGLISAIQRMSIHDGPGIRTTVFMKGCNMRCRWCHNPETWSSAPVLQHVSSLCVACGSCVSACPQSAIVLHGPYVNVDREKCNACGRCESACLAGAYEIIGRWVQPREIADEIEQDRDFFDTSGGGITISGGEPFLQSGFVIDLLKECRSRGLHTAVQTNLCVKWEKIEEALTYVDLWMCDLKCNDLRLHREWTGMDNMLVKENMVKLAESGADMTVRTPVIPGLNDDRTEIETMCGFLKGLGAEVRYELLPFHDMGFWKFSTLGLENPMDDIRSLKPDDIRGLNDILEQYGF